MPAKKDEEVKLKTKAKPKLQPKQGLAPYTRHGLAVVFLFALSLILFLSFFGLAGAVGIFIKKYLFLGIGWAAYTIPFVLLAVGYVFLVTEQLFRPRQLLGLSLMLVGITGLVHSGFDIVAGKVAASAGRGGGYLGYIVLYPLIQALGKWGSIVLLIALVIGGILVLFETSLAELVAKILEPVRRTRAIIGKIQSTERPQINYNGKPLSSSPSRVSEKDFNEADTKKFDHRPVLVGAVETEKTQPPLMEIKKTRAPKVEIPLELLTLHDGEPTAGDIEANQEKIKKTLENFGIEVEMGSVNIGPTVTQYTLKPSEGVKLASITGLSNDLALALAAHPIRIEAPIPGQALVGIEVPNKAVATVSLREMLSSAEFKSRKSNLVVAIGKDVAGRSVVADIDRMPHLLIAGATGTGKSVCINGIILSLLYANSADELKFIMVDPKRVELASYNDMPYLLTPVITDVPKTINALKWVVGEMDRRYQVLSAAGKRNLAAYNQTASETMPYIMVVIDELADLMAVAANEVEAAIIRLAQMARAVGIHLIVATQRPSVDVITGLIKANITSRLAFKVASQTDSRTILDNAGAEKLLGRGDCLFMSADYSKPKRLQGSLVTDGEIEGVTNFLKQSAKPEYDTTVVEKVSRNLEGGGFGSVEGDDLFEEARQLVIRSQKASASFLQRRLRVGYARAARLLDLLEEQGVIGPGEGAKPRDVLVKPSDMDLVEGPDDLATNNGEMDNNENSETNEEREESY